MRKILKKIILTIFDIFLDFIFIVGKIEAINKLLYFSKDAYSVYILRRFGADIGKDVGILPPLIVHTPKRYSDYKNIKIGDHCRIGRGTLLDLGGKIVIEDRVVIAMGVTLLTHVDMGTSPLASVKNYRKYSMIKIREGTFIGANSTLFGGVEIGSTSIIGAGSVVRKDVPPNSIVAGVPAKYVKNIETIC